MIKIKNAFFMSIGCVLLSAGIYFFKIPNNLVTGGVTGIGVLLAQITSLTAGAWIWILNVVLLLAGFFALGKETGFKTIYCSMLYSALTYLFEIVVPLSQPLTNQPCLEFSYAMILTSLGSAMIFYAGSSSGGTDIVALILKKYSSVDVGKALLITDFIVAVSSFTLFDIQTGLFSLLGLFVHAFIIDGVIENLNTCKYFIVITANKDKISKYIMDELHHGVTTHEVVGEYTGDTRYMIHTVCKRIEALKLKKRVKEMEKNSFVIITTCNEIIGRGFRGI